MHKNDLCDAVIAQIENDIKTKDCTALHEMLQFAPTEHLLSYLACKAVMSSDEFVDHITKRLRGMTVFQLIDLHNETFATNKAVKLKGLTVNGDAMIGIKE